MGVTNLKLTTSSLCSKGSAEKEYGKEEILRAQKMNHFQVARRRMPTFITHTRRKYSQSIRCVDMHQSKKRRMYTIRKLSSTSVLRVQRTEIGAKSARDWETFETEVLRSTKQWVDSWVIGQRLCPFAKPVRERKGDLAKTKFRYA